MREADPDNTCAQQARRIALWIALVACLVRLPLFLSPSRAVEADWVHLEEMHRGNVAQEILDGPLLPLQNYHHAPNHGGSLVIGVLAAPAFALLGPNLGVLRLATFLIGVLTAGILARLLARHVSARAGWLGGLLFAIPPPGYALNSIPALGTHVESNALALCVLALYLELDRRADERSFGGWRAFAMGACAGFGAYCEYSTLIVLAAVCVHAGLRDHRFFLRRRCLTAGAGFVCGFLPWITYNVSHRFGGAFLYRQPMLAPVGSTKALKEGAAKLVWFFQDYLPFSSYFRAWPDAPARAVEIALVVAGAAVVTHMLVRLFAHLRARRSLTLARGDAWALFPTYVVLFFPAFMLVNVGSPGMGLTWAHDGRYVVPLLPFVAACAGCTLDRLAQRGERALRAVVYGAALVLGLDLAGTLSFVNPSAFGEPFRTPATDPQVLADFLAWNYRLDVPRLDCILTRLEQRSEAQRVQVVAAFGAALLARVEVAKHGRGTPSARAGRGEEALAILQHMRERVGEECWQTAEVRFFGRAPPPGTSADPLGQPDQGDPDAASPR